MASTSIPPVLCIGELVETNHNCKYYTTIKTPQQRKLNILINSPKYEKPTQIQLPFSPTN